MEAGTWEWKSANLREREKAEGGYELCRRREADAPEGTILARPMVRNMQAQLSKKRRRRTKDVGQRHHADDEVAANLWSLPYSFSFK